MFIARQRVPIVAKRKQLAGYHVRAQTPLAPALFRPGEGCAAHPPLTLCGPPQRRLRHHGRFGWAMPCCRAWSAGPAVSRGDERPKILSISPLHYSRDLSPSLLPCCREETALRLYCSWVRLIRGQRSVSSERPCLLVSSDGDRQYVQYTLAACTACVWLLLSAGPCFGPQAAAPLAVLHTYM